MHPKGESLAQEENRDSECFHLLLTDPRVDLDVRDDYQRSPEEVNRLVFMAHSKLKKVVQTTDKTTTIIF